MSNENETLDCNVELTGVETAMPRLQTGDVRMRVDSTSVSPNKDQTGRNLVVKFVTVQEETSTVGTPVNAGLPITRYFPLQQSDNPKAPDFRRDICKLVDAAFGTDKDSRPSLNSETLMALKGKEIICKVTVRAAEGQYDESNEIRDYKPLGE